MLIRNSKKIDLYNILNSETGLSKNFIKSIVESIFQIIITGVIKDKRVKISGFGNFKLYKTKKRVGRNPKDMKEYIINQRNVVKFSPSKEFKNYLNNATK